MNNNALLQHLSGPTIADSDYHGLPRPSVSNHFLPKPRPKHVPNTFQKEPESKHVIKQSQRIFHSNINNKPSGRHRIPFQSQSSTNNLLDNVICTDYRNISNQAQFANPILTDSKWNGYKFHSDSKLNVQ